MCCYNYSNIFLVDKKIGFYRDMLVFLVEICIQIKKVPSSCEHGHLPNGYPTVFLISLLKDKVANGNDITGIIEIKLNLVHIIL